MALEKWFWGNFLKLKNRGKALYRKLPHPKFRGNNFRGNYQEFENPGETGKGKCGKKIPLNRF